MPDTDLCEPDVWLCHHSAGHILKCRLLPLFLIVDDFLSCMVRKNLLFILFFFHFLHLHYVNDIKLIFTHRIFIKYTIISIALVIYIMIKIFLFQFYFS